MTPQKVSNHTTKDLMNSEGDKASVCEHKRIMIKMPKEFKGNMQKQVKKIPENIDQ
jgi:hypothetical protein